MTAIIELVPTSDKNKDKRINRPNQTLLEAGPLRQVYVMRPVLENINDQLQAQSADASTIKKAQLRKEYEQIKINCMYVVEPENNGKSLTCNNVQFLGKSELKTSVEDGTIFVCGERHNVLRYRVYLETRDAILVTM